MIYFVLESNMKAAMLLLYVEVAFEVRIELV